MKKKVLALVLVVALVAALAVGLVACNKPDTNQPGVVKVGLICLHDQNSTYDKNFIDAMDRAFAELGLDKKTQLVVKTGIPENNTCYETAADLADEGCTVIFADSFGHEEFMMQAAREYPSVQFCHATGVNAHTAGIANFHNAFASIYEGRYLAGIAAGMKLKEMGETKMGYVGAFPYAEVKSGYTAFFLGAKSVVPEVTMDVKFTSSWYDYDKEQSTANALIDGGAKLISQHADSMGAPNACKAASVPNITYNVSTKADCPASYVAGSKINWTPYFKYMINQVKAGEAIDTDWVGTAANGAVEVLEINEAVAATGTKAAIDAAAAKLADGSLKVFDLSKFTVKGETLTEFMADVDSDAAFTADTNVVKTANGISYIAESEFRSAPYFTLDIDGITILE